MYIYLSFNALLDCLSMFSRAMSKFKYRDRVHIMRDILDTINRDPKGKTKTSIMRGANLNFEQVNKYLDFLVLCDAVKAANPLRSQELARYRLTQKGLRFLRNAEMWNLLMYSHQRKPV